MVVVVGQSLLDVSKSVTVSVRRGLSLLSGQGPSLDKRVLEGLQVYA